MVHLERDWRMIINGELESAEDTFAVRNPATGERVAEVPDGTADHADRAVAAARSAFDDWSQQKPEDRGHYLFELADRWEQHHEDLVELETIENGKPLFQSENDVTNAERITRFYAGAADKFRGETVLDTDEEVLKTVFEPLGVVVVVMPWNWPPIHTAEFVIPALATGNAVVLKPAPETPLSSLRMADLAMDHLPPGVFNVVTGGAEPGAALTGHADIDKIAFTGNSQTGVRIMEAAAENITPTMLELGGKNPAVVFPDADMEKTVSGLIYNAFYNSGQACTNPERILVHEEVYDEFVTEYGERVNNIIVGDGSDERTEVGPQITEAKRESVAEYIDRAVEDGAMVAGQAQLPEAPGLGDGFYSPPTALVDVTPEMEIVCEEVFGPVVSVLPFADETEAIEMANDTEYGLAASVWTGGVNRAHRVANEINAGIMTVNHPTRSRQGLPFGGYKRSGIGRKKGFGETLREYTQVKAIQMDLTDDTFSFSYGNR